MQRFFRARDPWGHGLSLWVVALMVFLLPLIIVGMMGLRLENEVTSWLPEDDPDAAALHWFHDQFEQDSKVLISWDSSSINDPRLAAFTRNLKTPSAGPYADMLSQGIRDVTAPEDLLQRMTENRLTPDEALQRLSGILIGTGYAKIRLTAAGARDKENSAQLIRGAVSAAIGRDVEILPPVEHLKPIGSAAPENRAASSGELASTDSAEIADTPADTAVEIPAHDLQLKWSLFSAADPRFALARAAALALQQGDEAIVDEVFIAPGAPVALAVSVSEYGLGHLEGTLDALHAAAVESGIPAKEIRMGGSPVGKARLNGSAAKALWNTEYPVWRFHKRSPVLLSALMGVLMSFVMLRSLRLALLVLLVSVYTCLIMLAVIPASGTTLSMVLVVLPNLLLVLTVSGAIHVANYWQHAASRGQPYPIAIAVGIATMPCFLASATTAIGMASLLTAVLKPVREFGIYSSIGCIISLAMILIGFPALMTVWPGKPGTEADLHKQEAAWERLARWLVRHRRFVCWSNLALFVVCCAGLYWFRTETKIIRYFPNHARIVQDYEFLETGLSGIVPVETIIRFNKSATGHQADADGEETDAASPESDAARLNILQRMELVRAIEAAVARQPGISGALSLADFRPVVEPPPAESSRLDKIRYGRTAQRYESEIFGDQAESASQFVTRAGQPLETSLNGRTVRIEPGDEIWRIRAQSIVMSDVDYTDLVRDVNAAVETAVGNTPGVDYVVTGLVPLFLRTQHALLESLINSFALAFVVIAIVMIMLLRSFWSGLLAMLPNLFPVGVVFGAVSWLQIPVDVGTMITASVALGIAIDGTLHLLTWFQEGLKQGLNRNDAIIAALKHCGPAMWQTSVAIAIAMQMLAGADLLLISRFGWLMSSLIMVALAGDVILLPALLTGWLGRLIEATTLKQASAGRSSDVTAELENAGDGVAA